MTKKFYKHSWIAEEYHQYSSAQWDAAHELLEKVKLDSDAHILDIGCGDGKITALLAQQVEAGHVVGIDASESMIAFAQSKFSKKDYPNLDFVLQDAQQIENRMEFDVLFSSFALQWIIDLDKFFLGAYASLKPNGIFVATIPLGISTNLEKAIDINVVKMEWASYFPNFSQMHFFKSDDYKSGLVKSKFTITDFSVVYQKVVFSGRPEFEKYIFSWFPYLRPLPDGLKEKFFKQIIDTYFEIHSLQNHKEVNLIFPRVDIIAVKSP